MQKIKIGSQVTKKDNFSLLLASLVFLFFGTAMTDQFFKNNPLAKSLVIIITVLYIYP